MINLDSLVSVVYMSVSKANQALQEQNQQLIGRFFDRVPVEKKSDTSSEHSDFNAFSESGQATPSTPEAALYRPKYVTMEYPFETSDGLKTMGVDVPLLTLVPMATPRISEVKFRTELEVSVTESNSLELSFPTNKKGGLFKSDKTSVPVAELEIVIDADEPPEGLKKLIEGYDRALRAQIPG